MSASRKKVIVRKLSRDWLAGYLPAAGFLQNQPGDARPGLNQPGLNQPGNDREGQIELLDLAGKITAVSLAEIKWICYVRDFNSGEPGNPERLLRKTFTSRPRGAGLWVRLRLKDNDTLEGLAANDQTLLENGGLFLLPPDTRANTQRLYLPRTAVSGLEVIAVIGGAVRRKAAAPDTEPLQESLFDPRNSVS